MVNKLWQTSVCQKTLRGESLGCGCMSCVRWVDSGQHSRLLACNEWVYLASSSPFALTAQRAIPFASFTIWGIKEIVRELVLKMKVQSHAN